MKKLFLGMIFSLVSYLIQAQTINISTGLDNASNALSIGTADPNWILSSSPYGAVPSLASAPHYVWTGVMPTPIAGSNAQWINKNNNPYGHLAGDYFYSRNISVSAGTSSLAFDFQVAYDDILTSLVIEDPIGNITSLTNVPTTTYALGNHHTPSIPSPMAGTWKIIAQVHYVDAVGGFLCSGIVTATAPTCNVLSDGFDSATAWIHPMTVNTCGTEYNQLDISGSKFNFIAARDNHFNYMYRNGLTISNTNWKAEIDFTPTAFGPSNGVGHNLLSLTAGTKPFSHDDASPSCSPNPICTYPGMFCGFSMQNGISLFYASNFPSGSTWEFTVRLNDGTGAVVSTVASIPTPNIAGTGTYYTRLERTSATTGVLGVYSDAARTTHITGSPVTFAIPASIAGFNTVQIGVDEGGYFPRQLTGTLDNLCISNTVVTPPCTAAATNVSGCACKPISLVGSPAGGTFSLPNPYTNTVAGTYTYTYTYTDAITGCTATSAPATITVLPSLPPAMTVTAGTITATVSWTPGQCIDKYSIWYREVGSIAWLTPLVLAPITSYNLTGLLPGTVYEIKIRTVNSCGTISSFSPITNFTTSSAPCGTAATIISASAASIKWNAVPGATVYNVHYKKTGGTLFTYCGPGVSCGAGMLCITPALGSLSPSGSASEVKIRNKCAGTCTSLDPWTAFGSVFSFASKESIAGLDVPTDISIFPNPTSDVLNIEFEANQSQNIEVKLFDLTGRLLNQVAFKSNEGLNQTSIDMKDLAAGNYVLQLFGDAKIIQTSKVQKGN